MVLARAGRRRRTGAALSNALTAAGVEVVAAPTPYTAFDYLHESPFDAAVLWGAEDHAPALSIAAGMKRNTRSYHIPLMLYLREETRSAWLNCSIAASPMSRPPTRPRAKRPSGSWLWPVHRIHLGIRKTLDSVRSLEVMDPETGLFTPELFASHLPCRRGPRAQAPTFRLRTEVKPNSSPGASGRLAGSRHAADRGHGFALSVSRTPLPAWPRRSSPSPATHVDRRVWPQNESPP